MDKEEGDTRGSSNIPAKIPEPQLEGTSLGQYLIKEFVPKMESTKKWVYKGFHPSLKVDICIKVLKYDERDLQVFLGEIDNLKELTHPNIERIFDAGLDKGHHYLVSKWIEGKNLREVIDSRKEFSLEEILNMNDSILDVLNYANKKGYPHTDVKLENVILVGSNGESLSERIRVVDFGPWSSKNKDEDEARDHVAGTAGMLEELLHHQRSPHQGIPPGLELVLENAKRKEYETPGEFKEAIDGYRRWITGRRKFLKIAGGTIALAVLSGIGYTSFRRIEHLEKLEEEKIRYLNSIDYTNDQLRETDATDYEKIDPIFKELNFRVHDQKTRWLAEEVVSPSNKFLFAISKERTEWNTTNGTYWSDGFTPGFFWRGYETTKESRFKELATRLSRKMPFTERDEFTINATRFYHSHVLGYKITNEDEFLDTALKAAKILSRRFNQNGNYFQGFGEINNSDIQEIQIDNMASVIPFISWAYKISNNREYLEMIKSHCDNTIKFNVNEDGSTVQIVKFNPRTNERLEGIASSGYNEESCLSRGQARAILGFSEAYKITKETKYLEIAEKCARYFIDNLPQDFVPFYDFKDPNYGIPKDSSAAAIAASGLLDLYKITSKREYKIEANKILKSLSTNYLSINKKYEGLLLHACRNKYKGAYSDCSVIYGDYYFVEALGKV